MDLGFWLLEFLVVRIHIKVRIRNP